MTLVWKTDNVLIDAVSNTSWGQKSVLLEVLRYAAKSKLFRFVGAETVTG